LQTTTHVNTILNMSANIHNVEGGYKATLSNSNSSEEAKKHAQEMLDKIASGKYSDEDFKPSNSSSSNSNSSSKTSDLSEDEKHRHHIEGGYKATLSNAKSSEEAKKHAQAMLDKIANGEELPESERTRAGQYSEDEKHRHHIEGGYKATLSNANSSEEAKKHAQAMLDKIANGEELPESERRGLKRSSDDVDSSNDKSESNESESGKGKQGFASMPKEKVQEIASKGGRTAHAGEEPSSKKSKSDDSSSKDTSDNKDSSEYTEEEKHNHHVLGGYKATLSNPNSSEEAKKHAQEMLDQHEKGNKSDSKSDSKSESKSDSKSESDKSESGKGKQGFASMPKEKVQEIASKGGRTAHAGEEPSAKKSESDSKSDDSESKDDDEKSGKGKQGFASMPKEKVQEIASKGGRTKHAGEEPAAVKNQ